MSEIRLAVLDMAGTTVSDDGAVERAFLEAMSSSGAESANHDPTRGLEYVRRTMGQSKIVVFHALFDGDEEAARAANRCFEQAFDAAIDRGEIDAISVPVARSPSCAPPESAFASPPASPRRRVTESSTHWAGARPSTWPSPPSTPVAAARSPT